MKRYENLRCTHAFILHMFPIIKRSSNCLDFASIDSLMNFQINTWNSLYFKPISNLTMICYDRKTIKRTLGLTVIYTCFVLWIHLLDIEGCGWKIRRVWVLGLTFYLGLFACGHLFGLIFCLHLCFRSVLLGLDYFKLSRNIISVVGMDLVYLKS